MRSPQLQKVYDFAKQIEENIWIKYKQTGKSPVRDKLRRSVLICLDEGSIFYWSNAYVESYTNEDGLWYIIFAEHHDTLVYHSDDVECIKQFRSGEVNIKKN